MKERSARKMLETWRWMENQQVCVRIDNCYGVCRWKRSAGTPPHFGTHGRWRLPLDIHSGCKYVVYGVRLWWKQGVPLPGCLI